MGDSALTCPFEIEDEIAFPCDVDWAIDFIPEQGILQKRLVLACTALRNSITSSSVSNSVTLFPVVVSSNGQSIFRRPERTDRPQERVSGDLEAGTADHWRVLSGRIPPGRASPALRWYVPYAVHLARRL